jgi:hypothetical protein
MPNNPDPWDLKNYRVPQSTRDALGNVLGPAAKILVPGPAALVNFLQQRPLQKLPGLDFFLNPTSYPSGTSFTDTVAWNTYETRHQQEQAGTWKNQPYQYQANDDPVSLANQHGITPQQLIDANPGGYPFSQGQTVSIPQYVHTPTTPQASNPTQSGFTPAGADNTDYSNTRAAQVYAAAGTPFLKQQRWDPQAKKYVSIGKLLKQGKLDLQGNWNKRSKRQRVTAAGNRQQAQQQQQQDHTLTNSMIKFGISSG